MSSMRIVPTLLVLAGVLAKEGSSVIDFLCSGTFLDLHRLSFLKIKA